MKNPKLRFLLFLIALFVSAVANSYAQGGRIQIGRLDHLEAKASQTVTVDVSENMIKIAAKFLNSKNHDEAAVKEIISGLKGVYVRSFEFDNDNEFSDADILTITSQLDPAKWARMVDVHSRKDGQRVDVYTLIDGTSAINGITVIAADKRQLTIVNVVGTIDIDKLAELSGKFDIPDIEIERTPKKKEAQ